MLNEEVVALRKLQMTCLARALAMLSIPAPEYPEDSPGPRNMQAISERFDEALALDLAWRACEHLSILAPLTDPNDPKDRVTKSWHNNVAAIKERLYTHTDESIEEARECYAILKVLAG